MATHGNGSPLRLLILGGGAVVTESYLPAFSRLGALSTVVVVDNSNAASMRIRQAFDSVRVEVGDYRTLLAQPDFTRNFDAAIITLPNHLHEDAAMRSFAAGLHVLCEKPLAMSEAACERLESGAREANRILMVGMVRRYFPSMTSVTNAIDSGLIGSLRSLKISHGGSFQWPSDSGAYFRRENGGVLINMGIHHLDLLERWAGPLMPVQYQDDCEGGVEANCEYHLTALRGEAEVVLKLSYSHELDNTIRVAGSTGDITLSVNAVKSANWRQFSPALQGDLTVPKSESITDSIAAFAEEISAFTDVVRGANAPIVSGDGAAHTTALIDWAYQHRQPLQAIPEVVGRSRPTLSPRKVAVIGGTGFVGSRLVRRLAALGFDEKEIVVPVRSYRAGATVGCFPVHRPLINLLDYNSVLEAIRGAKHVFHLAVGSGPDAEQITVEGTRNIVKAAIEAEAESVVVTSTTTVFGFQGREDGLPLDEGSPYRPELDQYGRSKAKMERECLIQARSSTRTRIVVLNPVVIYGPGCRMYVEFPVRAARSGGLCWIENGRGIVNYTHVDSMVDALLLAATCEAAHGQRFIISDGMCTFREFLSPLFGALADELPSHTRQELEAAHRGRRPRFSDVLRAMASREAVGIASSIPVLATTKRLVPNALKKKYKDLQLTSKTEQQPTTGAATIMPPPWVADLYGPFTAVYSSEKAQRVLHWRPAIDLAEGLQTCCEWLSFLGLSDTQKEMELARGAVKPGE